MEGTSMKTFVYVDAFNLYYGAVKDTPYKWLDLRALWSCHDPQEHGSLHQVFHSSGPA